MRIYALLIYAFLYLPIALIVVYSFNAGRYAMDWQGFSVEWYAKAFSNRFAMEALGPASRWRYGRPCLRPSSARSPRSASSACTARCERSSTV